MERFTSDWRVYPVFLGLLGGSILGLPMLGVPGWGDWAIAHQVQVVAEIAGTWHIEPNHNPKAGVPVLTWIALTRRGGKLLPLNQVNCGLAVYKKPRKSADKPILQPTLTPIAAEKYQDIPGATITFPKVGLYQLELNCSPKGKENFKPFRMQYDVTVAN